MTRRSASVFICATGDVACERKVAQLVIARIRQEYAGQLQIVDGEWDFDFEDCSMSPDSAEVAIFIFGARLPDPSIEPRRMGIKPEPISDIEWQFQKAIDSAKRTGRPLVCVFRKTQPVTLTLDESGRERVLRQMSNMQRFWAEWFVTEEGVFKSGWHEFDSTEAFELLLEPVFRLALALPVGGRQNIVFVSHASEDRQKVEELVSKLESANLKCWFAPRDVPGGKNYQDEIVLALEDAKAMVLVFSTAANQSDEIKKELALASSLGLLVVPVRIDDTDPTRGLRYELANRQWIDISDSNGHIGQVITALQKHFKLLEGDSIRAAS